MNWSYPTAAALILLCGCTGPPPRRAGSPPAAGAPVSVRPLPPAQARDGDRVAACRDGDCEVTVRSGTKIPLNRRFGMGPIAVTVDGEDVGLRSHSPGSDLSNTLTAPGTVTMNDIVVNVIDAHDNMATLRISHR